jgi:proteasome lid subunit RPN8/RPN11
VASDPNIRAIRIPRLLWGQMIFQLRRRSAGRRESGAFLVGRLKAGTPRVTSFICYDDLDPNAYDTGAIYFHDVGYSALWQHCRERKVEVLTDVHTHPSAGVAQSPIDRKNPMIPMVGHTAMIVPNFGRTPWWSLDGVGIYEYLGNFNWRTHYPSVAPGRINLTLW